MSQSEPVELQIPMPWGYIAGVWYGDQHIRPLLALHGWQDNAGSFARLAPLLAAYQPILAIDLPGHGRSTHFPLGISYNFKEFMRVVHRIALYYKWDKISFLAHSVGASLSFYYTVLFPANVDMIIAIDTLTTPYVPPNIQIDSATLITEKILIEEERSKKPATHFTFESLEDLLYRSSGQSIELENCKFLLERSVRPVDNKKDLYYFARDARVKFLDMVFSEPDLTMAMVSRLHNIYYLLIKAELSDYIKEENLQSIFAVLRANNPIFEFHTLKGEKHHLHLNSPEHVADCVVPFLQMCNAHRTASIAKL